MSFQVPNIYDHIPFLDVGCYVPKNLCRLAERMKSLISVKLTTNKFSPLVFLLSGLPGSGKKLLLKHLSSITHLNVLFFNCVNMWSDVPGTFEAKIDAAFQKGSFICDACFFSFSWKSF